MIHSEVRGEGERQSSEFRCFLFSSQISSGLCFVTERTSLCTRLVITSFCLYRFLILSLSLRIHPMVKDFVS